MSTAPRRKLTVAEYLAIEREAEFKSEFFNGEKLAMPRVSREHNRVKETLIGELGARLKGGLCHTLSSSQRVMVPASGLYTYPDIVILCDPLSYDPADPDTLVNPTAIIEVLSPSTERYDKGLKFRNYQQIPSMIEYVLAAQNEPVCDRYIRLVDGSWGLVSFVGLSATLEFTSIAARIPLADVYAGVVFPDPLPKGFGPTL